jgi:manganese/zinc/iron transport system ATP- binding protein
MNGAIDVEQLTVNYEKTSVLWDINFSIPQGKLVGVIGPNGAGKITLLKSLIGIVSPIAGKIHFYGKPFKQVRQKIAYVPQRSSVDWDFPITAFDLVLMGSYGRLGMLKWASAKEKEKAKKALEKVDMLSLADRQIRKLSGGEQQRLFVARALLQEAEIYLLDEPFAGIDAEAEKRVLAIFENLQQEGKTVVAVHHDLNTAERYFNWIVLLNTCLIASGPTKDVFSKENLYRTYGRSPSLLDEAAKMAQDKTLGLR